MKTRGSCLCGAIAYTLTETAGGMSHCHCSICRKLHGALFATYLSAPRDAFSWDSGADHLVIYESSPGVRRAFCLTCGSVAPEPLDTRVAVPAGSLEGDCGLRPSCHIFVSSRASWHEITDDLPQYGDYQPGRDLPSIERESRSGGGRDGVTAGSCECGAVRFEYERQPRLVMNCHCSRCRKARGAAYATNVLVAAADFRWTKGADEIVVYRLPGTERFGNAFCRHCGSPVARAVPKTSLMDVPAGSLDDDPRTPPGAHIYVGSKAPWFEVTDGLPQYPEMPPPG